jgi:hypothetical protein
MLNAQIQKHSLQELKGKHKKLKSNYEDMLFLQTEATLKAESSKAEADSSELKRKRNLDD